MKANDQSLFSALLVGLLLNTMLASQSAYSARAGLLAAPLSAAVLGGTCQAFACSWRQGAGRTGRALLALLLTGSAALEVLRVWRLADAVYPDGITLAATCLTVLLPVLYLRRAGALVQTANVLLCLLLAATAAMVLALAPHLRPRNLQLFALSAADWRKVLGAQCSLYPEYLLLALCPCAPEQGGRLAAEAVSFEAGTHLLLELFFGAGLTGRGDPLHTAARSGALSVFNRLEWIQLLLWTMAAALKLALYLYALARLCGVLPSTGGQEDPPVGLRAAGGYLLVLLALCTLLHTADVEQALAWRAKAAWLLAGTVIVRGGLRRCIRAWRPV